MIDEIELLKKRAWELSARALQENRYMYTGFLNLAEAAALADEAVRSGWPGFELYGGHRECERKMARFGSPEELLYEEVYPISCIGIWPARSGIEPLPGHRDCLGALINLGLKRSALGDIIRQEKAVFVFCSNTISPFIIANLTRVGNQEVFCVLKEDSDSLEYYKDRLPEAFSVSSERIDALVAKTFRLSRSASAALLKARAVFIDGRLCESISAVPRSGDVISVRGHGKFKYEGVLYKTKKDRLKVRILRYN